LLREGSVDRAALGRAAISEQELLATLRIETQDDALASIEEAALETNGKISFITRRGGQLAGASVEAERSSTGSA
jgi:uncharacterized membrane protein YcaP (DUF421 family)